MPGTTSYSSTAPVYSALGNPNFQAGNREDLTDIIELIAPEEFPVLNMASKVKSTATYYEWQMDDLAVVDTSGIPEGQDFTSFNNEAAPRVRTGNFIQRFGRPYAVSVEQSLVNIAGVGNEFDRSKMKATKELMRSIEAAICSDNDMQSGGVAPAKFRGLGSYISSSAQTNNPVPTAYLTPSGSIVSGAHTTFTEATFKGIIQSLYSQTGETGLGYDYVCGPANRSQISTFTKSSVISSTATDTRRQNANADAKTLYDGVDLYDSDYGMVRIMPSLFLGLTSGQNPKNVASQNEQNWRGYFLRPDLIELAYLRDIGAQELPDLGGGRRGFVDALLTLVVKNPLGFGKVTY